MKGIKRNKGDTVRQKLPITPELLIGVHSKLNTRHSFDASFWAICLTAFYSLFRKSHLLPTSRKSFDPNRQFTKQDFVFFSWGILLSVRWIKTIQFRERVVRIPIPYIPNSVLCPCRAIAAAFAFTKHGEDSMHAFSWIDHRTLRIYSFTSSAFLSKLKACLTLVGVDPSQYAGHSFRQGGASFAFQAGIPIEMIKLLGHWKSNAVLLYLTVPLNICLKTVNTITISMIQHNY